MPRLETGITERQFALELEFAMRERGASGNSFDPIIAAGPNGAKPHARPSDRVIGRNELVVCDFGCIVDGYCSDMTRTVSVGDPGADARHLYDVVLASQQAGRALVAADVACSEIDRASRDVIAEAGWAEAFSHSTGHGVGLEIHEAPRVAATARDTLLVGDVVTVEPGVYLPGIGGVRIEDTVVVTATGFRAADSHPQGSRAVSISTNDLKNGMALDLPEGLVNVVEFQHVKPGKGGAFVRTKLKNVRTGAVIDRTFRADEKVTLATIDKREMQFLYREGADYVFMDNENYDQLQVPSDSIGDAINFLKEGDTAVLPMYNDEIVGIELPAAVELEVTDTEPGMQGDRVSGARKAATLETGLIVQVPLFVNVGDRVKVDTRSSDYLSRA